MYVCWVLYVVCVSVCILYSLFKSRSLLFIHITQYIYKNVTELNCNKNNNSKLSRESHDRRQPVADLNYNRRLVVNCLDRRWTLFLISVVWRLSVMDLSFPIWLPHFYDIHAEWTPRTSLLCSGDISVLLEKYLVWLDSMIALQAMRMWANLHTYDKRHVDTDSCRPVHTKSRTERRKKKEQMDNSNKIMHSD